MANIVIVTGSVRQVNVNAGIVDIIAVEVNGRDGLTAQVADLGALNLPFFNAPTVVLLRQKRFGVRLSLPWTN